MILLLATVCVFCNHFVQGGLIHNLFLKESQKKENSSNKKWKPQESSMQQWPHYNGPLYGAPVYDLQFGSLLPVINTWNEYGVMFHCLDNMYGHMYDQWKPKFPAVISTTTVASSSIQPTETPEQETNENTRRKRKDGTGLTPRRLIRRKNSKRRGRPNFSNKQDYSTDRYDDIDISSYSDESEDTPESDYNDDEYAYDTLDSSEPHDSDRNLKHSRRSGHRGGSSRNRGSKRQRIRTRSRKKADSSYEETRHEVSRNEDTRIRSSTGLKMKESSSILDSDKDELHEKAENPLSQTNTPDLKVDFSANKRGHSKVYWKRIE